MENWSIKSRILAAFSVVILIIGFLTVFTFHLLDTIRARATEITADSLPGLLYMTEIDSRVRMNYALTLRRIGQPAAAESKEYGEQIQTNDARIALLLKGYETTVFEQKDRELLESLKRQLAPFAAAKQAVSRSDPPNAVESAALLRSFDAAEDRLIGTIEAEVDYNKHSMQKDVREVVDEVQSSKRLMIAALLFGILCSGVTTIVLLRTIVGLVEDIRTTGIQVVTTATELEQVKRVASLGQLAASMAHEFNNVLMGIQPFADVISRLVPDQKDVQKSVARIQQSVARGRGVTDEILRFTRRVAPVKKVIAVREWLSNFVPEAEALVGDRFRVEVQSGREDLEILGDVSQLNQVIANLVINARDASAPGDLISISAETCCSDAFGLDPPSGYVQVTVRDRGTGMDRAVLDQVFEPLFTTKRTGTGLGLAISRQVVIAHEGKLVAESAVGKGTAFHILLPLAERRFQPGAIGSHGMRRPVPSSVLIVEDEQAVADGLREILALEQVTTSVVYRGAEAIAAIERNDPEVVLLDIGLTDMSGVTLLEEILARWPQRRVVFMTGHYDRKELTDLLLLPHIGFLQKPFDTLKLLDALVAVGHSVSPAA